MQQRCTALCYAIADRLQKNVGESDRALELLLAALNDEQSKITLELYLEVGYKQDTYSTYKQDLVAITQTLLFVF